MDLLLADDHVMVREALRRVIEGRGDITVVAEASDGREAVSLARRHSPNVAVLDLWMPVLSGEEATRQIVSNGCGTRVLILSMHEEWNHVRRAFEAGASGYLVKSAASRELLDAIDAVSAGRSYVSPAIACHVVAASGEERGRTDPLSLLTPREHEVLQLVSEGLSSKEIATQLGLSIKTAESHRASLMKKLGVRKTSALVRLALREGLIAP